MKFAVLYRRRQKFFIGAQGRTTAGVLIGLEQPVAIDAVVDASELGAMLRESLARSKSPLPHPQLTEWPTITATFLRGTGVKTWGAFVRGSSPHDD